MRKRLLKQRWIGVAFATWMVVLFLGVCPYLCPPVQAKEVVPPCHKEAESAAPSERETHDCCREEFNSYLPNTQFDLITPSLTTVLFVLSDWLDSQSNQELRGLFSSERAPPLLATSVANKVTLNL
ncbi:MAG: hypothetical protein HY539_01190 [Deltaproteobacteria bacterium]|nr:hypothetical protein [Deltaproteobacteria bacterium]